MKKLILLTAVALGLFTTACNNDNDITEGGGGDNNYTQAQLDSALRANYFLNNPSNAQVAREEHLKPEEMADFLFGPAGANGDEKAEEARQAFITRSRELSDSLANVTGENGVIMGYYKGSFNYETIDENGNPITLSAFLGYAEYWFGGYKPLSQSNYYFVCPYTHTKEEQCGSKSNGGYEFSALTGENLFVMPDGQGFGNDQGKDQTYLAHRLHARQYYDALVAGYNIYTKNRGGDMEDDWRLRVIGASQGAGDAIALHRYLDTEGTSVSLEGIPEGMTDFICDLYGVPHGTKSIFLSYGNINRFEYSYVCDGPFCPEATMLKYYDWGVLNYPCVIPLVIKSMLKCHPELRAKYKEEDFYSDMYNRHKKELDEAYTYKTLDADDLNILMRKCLAVEREDMAPKDVPLSRILSTEALNKNSDIARDLLSCLAEEDLTHGWTPVTKSYIYYSPKDDVVPYVNTENLIKLFGSKIEAEEAFFDGHVTTCGRFMTKWW